MTLTELIILLVVAVIVIAIVHALFRGIVVVLVIVAIAILLGGYSVSQFKHDASSVIDKTHQLACPANAAAQLRTDEILNRRVDALLARPNLTAARSNALSVQGAKLKTQIVHLTACSRM